MRFAAVLAVLSLFAAAGAFGQATEASPGSDGPAGVAEAPLAKPVVATPLQPIKAAKPAHKFLDLKNSMAITAFGAALAGDSYSTQRALAYPGLRELNPVAQPFVSSRAGEIAYSGAGFALFDGGMDQGP